MSKSSNNWRGLLLAIEAVHRQRSYLQDHDKQARYIKRPKGMETRDYERHLRLLREAEQRVKKYSQLVFVLKEDNQ